MKYAEKIEQMKNGTYHGNSPFYNNIPEFQYLKPLASYPHLQNLRPTDKVILTQRQYDVLNKMS